MNKKDQSTRRIGCLVLLVILVLSYPLNLAAQDETALPNNFADISTIDYPSGLRVYLKSMPHVDNVYISALLPVGSTHDPRNRQGLAHFVEHMLFTDSQGRSEAAIRKEVSDRGGNMNASTSAYRTFYYIDLPAKEWAFGLDWFQRLLAGHKFTPMAVAEERLAVSLEKSRASNTPAILENIRETLRATSKGNDFWNREFGLKRERRSVIGTDRSIQSITQDDLQNFYDRYYHPANVTLLVFGNVDSAEVRNTLDAGFGQWNSSGEVIDVFQKADTASDYKVGYDYSFKRSQDYTASWKLYEPAASDIEMAEFLAAILRQLLLDKLRVERKTTYGTNVSYESYAGHGRLIINGSYATSEMDYAISVIDTAIDELKSGTFDPLKFEELRKRAVDLLLLGSQTTAAVTSRCNIYTLCNKLLYQDFPDMIGHWQTVSSADLGLWMQGNLLQERRVDQFVSPSPLGIPLVFLLTVGAAALAILMRRRSWLQPIPMHTLRYLCKLRAPSGPIIWLKIALSLPLAVFVGFMAGVLGVPFTRMANSIDSILVQSWYPVLMTFVLIFIWLGFTVQKPRKLLLFEHEWRLKSKLWKTVRHEYQDIAELQEFSRKEMRKHPQAHNTKWYHDGFGGKGIYIGLKSGRGYYLRVRDNIELLNLFQKSMGRSG